MTSFVLPTAAIAAFVFVIPISSVSAAFPVSSVAFFKAYFVLNSRSVLFSRISGRAEMKTMRPSPSARARGRNPGTTHGRGYFCPPAPDTGVPRTGTASIVKVSSTSARTMRPRL